MPVLREVLKWSKKTWGCFFVVYIFYRKERGGGSNGKQNTSKRVAG